MGTIVVRPVRFTNDVARMQAFLEAVGLRPRIEARGGGWVDLIADSGMVALHDAATSAIGAKPGQTCLSFEANDLDQLADAVARRRRPRRHGARRGLWPGAQLHRPARRPDLGRRPYRRPLRLPHTPGVAARGRPVRCAGALHRPAGPVRRLADRARPRPGSGTRTSPTSGSTRATASTATSACTTSTPSPRPTCRSSRSRICTPHLRDARASRRGRCPVGGGGPRRRARDRGGLRVDAVRDGPGRPGGASARGAVILKDTAGRDTTGVTEEHSSDAGTRSRLRDDADFRRYFAARLLSSTGTAVTFVALPVLVYRLSGSPFLTALVSALEAAPYVVVRPALRCPGRPMGPAAGDGLRRTSQPRS